MKSLVLPSVLAAPASSAAASPVIAWHRWTLLAAAAWNILGGVSALLDPVKQLGQLFHGRLPLEDTAVLFFYRCTWINVIAWGVAYLFAAFLPAARVPALAAGAAGKLLYLGAAAAAVIAGTGRPMLLISGVVDLAFVGLFITILLQARRSTARQ